MYLPITCQEPIAGTVVTAAGEGQTWNVVGDQITCKVASEQTDETYAVIEELSPHLKAARLFTCTGPRTRSFTLLRTIIRSSQACGNRQTP
jgi:hypothetical protein